MVEQISYKGKYGTVIETVTYNEVDLPNIMVGTIYTGYHKPVVGEEMHLSSCDIPFHDNYRDCFNTKPNDDELFSIVILELLDYDDSNYDPRKCRNGGKYLTSTWVIRHIIRTDTFKERCC